MIAFAKINGLTANEYQLSFGEAAKSWGKNDSLNIELIQPSRNNRRQSTTKHRTRAIMTKATIIMWYAKLHPQTPTNPPPTNPHDLAESAEST